MIIFDVADKGAIARLCNLQASLREETFFEQFKAPEIKKEGFKIVERIKEALIHRVHQGPLKSCFD